MLMDMAIPKGVSVGRRMGSRSFVACSEQCMMGSHSFACRMSFVNSVIGSDVTHHSDGQGDPPKVRCNPNGSVLSTMIMHLAAVLPSMVVHRYVDLKSAFAPSMTVVGWQMTDTM